MIYDTKKLKEDTRKDFFGAWEATRGAYPKPNDAFKDALLKPSKPEPHPIPNTIQKIRSSFLRLGFREVENPLFIEEGDVYKQYGPEAPAILDRCYYLSGLPRPEIGLSENRVKTIKKEVPSFSNDSVPKLKDILREYKLGRIEGDDLVETIEQRLGIDTNDATKILSLFEELRKLSPEASKTTLRSHMTAAWFPTIEALQDKLPHPIKLFSIGLRFRREQKIDATHLRAHYGASCIVCDKDMEIEAGKAIAREILTPLGFKDFSYIKKQATSTYYAKDSEYEVFAKSGEEDIEVADLGMYSPLALAQYDIKYPVFNIGFGIERIIMVKEKIADVREVMFPQFYMPVQLSDEQIAESITIAKSPKTPAGQKLSELIEDVANKNPDKESPCEVEIYSGDFLGKNINVKLIEKEDNTKLLGPAALNDIYVYEGGIYGIPKAGFKERAKEIKEKGLPTGISYMKAMADFFAAGIEKAAEDSKPYESAFKMAKSAPDINIRVGEHALKYIQSKNREVMLKGPLFTAIEMRIV